MNVGETGLEAADLDAGNRLRVLGGARAYSELAYACGFSHEFERRTERLTTETQEELARSGVRLVNL